MREPGNPAMAGFSLVELMITITLFAILLAIAVPSFKDASLGSQLRSVANAFVSSAALARSEAIKRNAVVTLCASADGATCGGGNWAQGWIITQGGTVVHSEPAITTGFKVVEAGALTSLNFQPIGAGATAASLTVCRASPTVGKQSRVITIDAAGRAWLKVTNSTTCP